MVASSPKLASVGAIDDFTAVLGGATARELTVAAAAFLTANSSRKQFTRRELHEAMKTSCYYRESYGNNLTRILAKLVEAKDFNRISRGIYVISPRFWQRIVDQLPQYMVTHEDHDPYPKLRHHVEQIDNCRSRGFLTEAVQCLEHRLYRSAIVLSWVGAVSILQSYVLHHALERFSVEALRMYPKSKMIETEDDFGFMRESDFLDILAAASVIGRDVKRQLKECLVRRNSCSHPNTLTVEHYQVSAHMEILILHVFAKFA